MEPQSMICWVALVDDDLLKLWYVDEIKGNNEGVKDGEFTDRPLLKIAQEGNKSFPYVNLLIMTFSQVIIKTQIIMQLRMMHYGHIMIFLRTYVNILS